MPVKLARFLGYIKITWKTIQPFNSSLSSCSKFHTSVPMMSTENAGSKISKLTKRIGTHNGVFHCDEALACFMLKQIPEYREADIVRTRDPDVLDECDIVVDVGGAYDPKTNRYDHHQRSFNETFSIVKSVTGTEKSVKLSSAGLVYAHYGLEVISEALGRKKLTINSDSLKSIFLHIYDTFVEEIDAIDNGVPMYPVGTPVYRISTNLSARVHRLNPEWNTPDPEPADKLFVKAMELVGTEFVERIIEAATVWWPAREIVKNSIAKRFETHESGRIVLLEERCPWKEHLIELESELGIKDELKFVIFHDQGGSWRIQAIPVQPDSFICRVFLHEKWWGIRDNELSDVSGIPDAIFCHATGFIGGNKTKEGALQMALKSLEAHSSVASDPQ